MKRFIPFILILSIFLCACNGSHPENVPATQEPTIGVVQTEPQPPLTELETEASAEFSQLPMCAVSLPIHTELTHNEQCSFTYQNIHLFCQSQDSADRIILDYLNRQDAHRRAAQTEPSINYQVLYNPTRVDLGVMSLYGESVLHKGRNHPIVECEAMNYSMVSGEILTLGSILKDSSAHDKLEDELLFAAESAAQTEQLYKDYPQIIADRFSKNPSFDEDWYFTATGIAFYFVPYEIAPYTSGVVNLEIPYSRLVGIIDDSFFPPEEDHSEGSLQAAFMDQIKLADYTQIAEVYINGYSAGAFLYSDGLLRDIRIELLNDHGEISGQPIFAANTLSTGDGIMLMYDPEEETSTLRITYRSNHKVISQDFYFDHDGAFVLT